MKDVELKMLERAKELLESGEVARVIGWKKGEFYHDPSPASFETVEELDGFVQRILRGKPFQISHSNEQKGRKNSDLLETLRFLQLQSACKRISRKA